MRPDDALSATPIGHLEVPDFKARLDRGEPFAVLDVREDHERDYAVIALPGRMTDLHVPLGQIPERLGEIKAARQGCALVIYCHHGQRSMVAASWLARQGVADLFNLEGGIDAWSRRVDPSSRRY